MSRPMHSLELTMRGRVVVGLLCLAGFAAWLTGDMHSRLAAALLLAPLLVDFVGKSRRLDRMQIRVGPRRIAAGAPFLETVTLSLGGTRMGLRQFRFVEPRTLTFHGGAVVEYLAPGEELRVQLHCRSRTRSHLLERVFQMESLFPLGLLRARSVIKIPCDMVTEPARIEIPQSLLRSSADGAPAWRANDLVGGQEFHSLRELVVGEDARKVHALRSAAMGTLVRRVERGQQPRRIGLVIDLRRPPGRQLTLGQQRFEWSLSAGASIIDLMQSVGMTGQCLIIGGEEHLLCDLNDHNGRSDVLTWLSEAMPVAHTPAAVELLEPLRGSEACYWIPAGGYLARSEIESMDIDITVVGADEL